MKKTLFLVILYLITALNTAHADNLTEQLDDFYSIWRSTNNIYLYKSKEAAANWNEGDAHNVGHVVKLQFLGECFSNARRRMFYKAKVIRYSRFSQHAGKVGYADDSPSWLSKCFKDPNVYNAKLNHILNSAIADGNIAIVNRIINEFSHSPISSKAKQQKETYLARVAERAQSIKNEYRKSFSAEEAMWNFSKKWIANAESIGVSYQNTISEVEYKKLSAAILNSISKSNDIAKYHRYINEVAKSSDLKEKAISSVYSLVQRQGNIAGYEWFIREYPKSKESRSALNNIYQMAFGVATGIDTIASYNDFVIAYPYSDFVEKANDRAYELEKDEFTGWFANEEKNSRALLVKSKQLERVARDVSSEQQAGYFIVVNRMNQLLQDQFPAEEATLRYLESEEFKDFYRDFKRTMRNIESALSDIRDNTSNLSGLLSRQAKLIDGHFRKAAQSREMAEELTRQHRHWERYMKKEA